MKKYEYKLLTISAFHLRQSMFRAKLEEKFQQWGEEGWDLVKMEPVQGGTWIYWASTSKFLVVFKREKV